MKTIAQAKFLVEAQQLIAQLAQTHGLEVDVTEREEGLTVRLQQDEASARAEFELYAHKFGYKPEHFGHEFVGNGELYRIVGVKPTAEKNCFRIRRVKDGKEFVCGKAFAGIAMSPLQFS